MVRHRRSAFSLLELVVVIAIVGLLVGLTASAVQRVRTSAARASGLNNVRQLALGLHQFHDRHAVLPPGWARDLKSPDTANLSWHARILPYIEQDPLWQEVVAATAEAPPFKTRTPRHLVIQRTSVPVFTCPSDPRGPVGTPTEYVSQVAMTTYLGNLGIDSITNNGVLFLNSRVKMTDVTDGSSNTLLIGERPHSADLRFGWWYHGVGQNSDGSVEVVMGVREVNYSPMQDPCPYGPYGFQPTSLNTPCDQFNFWSFHPGGGHFAFADGSVRFLRYEADPVMPALATRAGGEAVTVPE